MAEIPLDIEIEKAIRVLAKFMPQSQDDFKKSPFFHDVRVGMYLWKKGHTRDIVLAGFLHDALEHSEADEEMIRKEFGETVAKLVRANSKDYSIEDSWKRVEELLVRTAKAGQDAMIIRAADTLDSFEHYTKTKNESELAYCRKNAEELFKHLPKGANDEAFEDLRKFVN